LSLIILAKYRCFGKNNDGSIESKQVVQHYGKGSNAKRQEAHTFICSFFPDRKFVLSNDLGNDKVYSIIQSKFGKHSIKSNSFAVEAGSGPRHLTFSKREVCLCITGTY
jgi:6-phosphogluconolactonase